VKFRSERDALQDALATASRAAATRGSALPVLSGLRIEAGGSRLQVTGSDLDLTIQVDLEVNVDEEGVCVVPARLITDIVRAFEPGAVSFEVDEGDARISSGRSQFSVRLLPTEEFVRVAPLEGEAVTLGASDFAEALRQVVPAASHDDARPILTGVLMAAEAGGLRLVATDSYRLALRDLPGTTVLHEGQKVLVPSRALSELARLLAGADQATLRFSDDAVGFEVGDVRMRTRLLEGEFPNYQQLIPSGYPNRAIIDKEPLLEAVRRVKLLARESSTPVRLSLKPDGLELTAVTQDLGEAREDIDAKYEGAEMVVAFNPEFLIDGVDAIAGDEVQLETLDSLKPATVRPTDGSEYLYLLMPVRVT
jgi:DNA polymerase-3 subunit beta